MDTNNPYAQQYAPTQQQYPPPPPQYGQQQYPPPPQQYAQPPQGYYNSQQPPQYNPPPEQPQAVSQPFNQSSGYAELGDAPINASDKIRPSSGFKDIWAAILWIINFAGFIAMTVIAFNNMKGTSSGGAPTKSPSGSGQIFLNTEAVKIFGLSAAVGFVLSFGYLLIANM